MTHFLNQLWHLESLMLETHLIEDDHTGNVIAAMLTEIVNEWNISDKVRVVISENAANITAACRKLCWRHVPWTEHCLHLAVKHALDSDKTVKGIVKKVKEIAGFFHKSVKANDRLMQLQWEGSEEEPKKLKQECETRWNSTYTMLQRFVTIHRYVHTTLTPLNKGAMCISEDELKIIESTLKVLQPFLETTEELSGDKFPSMCLVLELVRSLQEILISQSTGARPFQLAEEILKQMRKYFGNHESPFYVAGACVLDPRIKKVPFSSDNAYQAIHQRLVAELQSFNRSTDAIATVDTSTAEIWTLKPGSLWDSFDQRVEALEHSRTPHVIELANYLKEPLLKRTEDPLLWWSQRTAVYPQLHKLARRQCLQLLSFQKDCFRLLENSFLKPKNVNNLLFLNKSLRKDIHVCVFSFF